MNTTFSQRLTAVSFAVVMTLGMLVGVNGLATQDTPVSGDWAQQRHAPSQTAAAALSADAVAKVANPV
jgi:hypothetical protein